MTNEYTGPDAPRPDEGAGEAFRLEQLSTLLDGELETEERAAAEALLASDESARALYDDLQLVQTSLVALEPLPAPRSFALPSASVPSRRGLFARFEILLRLGSAAAAVLFVVALAGGGSLQTATTSLDAPGEVTLSASQGESLEAATAAEPEAGRLAQEEAAEAPGAEPDAAGGAGSGNDALAPPSDSSAAPPEEAPADTPLAQDDEAAESAAEPADTDGAREESLAEGAGADGELVDGAVARASDESFGGAPASLGALALLMAALSVVITWHRRSA